MTRADAMPVFMQDVLMWVVVRPLCCRWSAGCVQRLQRVNVGDHPGGPVRH